MVRGDAIVLLEHNLFCLVRIFCDCVVVQFDSFAFAVRMEASSHTDRFRAQHLRQSANFSPGAQQCSESILEVTKDELENIALESTRTIDIVFMVGPRLKKTVTAQGGVLVPPLLQAIEMAQGTNNGSVFYRKIKRLILFSFSVSRPHLSHGCGK
jgi:hypothetical protein